VNLTKAAAYNARQHASKRIEALAAWGWLSPDVAATEAGSVEEVAAVAAWQTQLGVDADGFCGPQTRAAARKLYWPDQPKIPHGAVERNEVYGNPGRKPSPNDPRRILVDASWRASNIRMMQLGARSYPAHRLIATEAPEIFAKACAATGYHPGCDGVFVPRFINWSPDNDPSTHTWGAAIDFDAKHNGRKNSKSKMHEHRLWPAIWEVAGWTWGGEFRTTDPMHFQRGSGF